MNLKKLIMYVVGGISIIIALAAAAIGYGMGAVSSNSNQDSDVYIIAGLLLLVIVLALAVLAGQLITARVSDLIAKGKAEVQEERSRDVEIRNQLVSDAAHELRTPITILRGHMETMLTGAQEISRESLIPLLDETKRMTRLIRELQQLNLAEAGRLELDRSWITFDELLHEVVEILRAEAEEKGMTLLCSAEIHFEVYCDPVRIKQVLINLIGNAIRYTSEKGRVEIDCRKEREGYIRIVVKDDGPGISPNNLPYLFHRFYRVDDSRNRSIGGTGLGLAIAKQFVEAHGGSLSVSSVLEAGTEFIIELPMFPDL